MGKPLLTDEMIARAKRSEHLPQEDDYLDSEETLIIRTDGTSSDTDTEDFGSEEPIIKSRRIENAKRGEFQSKLNRILLLILILLGILIYAVLNW